MPLLNDADAIYIGSEPALRVMLGRTQVWAPAAEAVGFGTLNTGGGGNWGMSSDRMMLTKWTLAQDIIAKRIRLGMLPNNPMTDTTPIKGVIYNNGGTAGAAGLLMVASEEFVLPATYPGGQQWLAVPDTLLVAGDYWIGGIADNFTGVFDSGEPVASGRTVMFNGNTPFASPGSLVGETVTASYANSLACYVEGVPA